MDERDEGFAPEICAICAAEVDVARERGFVHSEDFVLCYTCALEHDGKYDADQDRWVRAPQVV